MERRQFGSWLSLERKVIGRCGLKSSWPKQWSRNTRTSCWVSRPHRSMTKIWIRVRMQTSQRLKQEKLTKKPTMTLCCHVMMRSVLAAIVDAVPTTDLPDGDAAKAWKWLLAKYKPSTESEKVRLNWEFMTSKLKTASDDPDAWLTELERKCQCMKTLGMTKNDNDIIWHVLNNLPKSMTEQWNTSKRNWVSRS